MDFEAVRRSLSNADEKGEETVAVDSLRPRFYEALVVSGLHIGLIEQGRVICSLTVPPRLCNDGKHLHSGAIATLVDMMGSAVFYSAGYPMSGVSVEINVSHLGAAFIGEEIELEAKLLHGDEAFGVVNVEVRKTSNGRIIAEARHTKYLPASSKL